MTDESILDSIEIERGSTGLNHKNIQLVESIVLDMKRPIKVEGRVGKKWVILFENRVLDEAQIVSVETGTPVGWRADEIVYEQHTANITEVIKWLAVNHEVVDDERSS